jgi:thymidylate synthase
MDTHEVLNANLTLTNPRARIITSPIRKVNYSFAVGEFIWYWKGMNDLPFISRYNSRLKNFSDDGKTLNSAYGRRLFGPQGRGVSEGQSQWTTVKQILSTDPESRRAIMHILNQDDASKFSKDVPCTCTLQFFIRSGALHLHAHMRSNDVFWGLPYDVFSFTLMQEAMAAELNVELGHYYHTAGSMHIYQRHFETALKICGEVLSPSDPMPELTVSRSDSRDFWNKNALVSLWRACEAEAYISTKQVVPDLLRPAVGSCEEWMLSRLYDKWGPADEVTE